MSIDCINQLPLFVADPKKIQERSQAVKATVSLCGSKGHQEIMSK
jgi:hypothetical protein